MTMDVDVTIALPPERVCPLVKVLIAKGFMSRVDDLDAFFARSRVVPLVHRKTKMPLDLVVARDALELAFIDRARIVDVGGLKVPVITPEDLVVTKLFAGRPRDFEDVRSVLGALAGTIDLRYVRSLLGQIDEAENRAELIPTLERLLREADEEA